MKFALSKKVFRYLQNAPGPLHYAVAIFSTLLFCYIDWISRTEIAFDIFYLIPIYYSVWFLPRKAVVGVVLLCAFAWEFASSPEIDTTGSLFIVLWNAVGHLLLFAIFAVLADRIKHHIEGLRKLALIDPLTQIANRSGFANAVNAERNRSARYGSPFTIAYIDIDDFKRINDTYGHDAGDELLVSVSKVFKKATRSTDTPARWGGDEFVLLLPETDAAHAQGMIEQLKQHLNSSPDISKHAVTFSIGVVTFRNPPDLESMLKKVDEVMYRVKKSGKNDIYFEENEIAACLST